MEKPYIKKIAKRGHIDVWLVDGKYVRENINHDFTNFGQHYICKFIPQNEFWIDWEHKKGEAKFFIDHMLTEHRLMAEGKSDSDAIGIADKVERRERRNSTLAKEAYKEKENKKDLIEKVHRAQLKEYGPKINVWIVSGELVRDFFYTDFTEGGHDRVYAFIPEDEVWLDDDLNPQERKFVLLHELHERNLMPDNKQIHIKSGSVIEDKNYNKIYGSAHRSASRLEYFCRYHPEKLDKKIKAEINKI